MPDHIDPFQDGVQLGAVHKVKKGARATGNPLYDALERAYREGQGAGNVDFIATSGRQEMISLDVDPPYAQTWMVTLMMAQPKGGSPVTYAPAAAIQDVVLANTVEMVYGNRPLQARIEFGTAQDREIAFVDWPAKGVTFEVHAASLRVSVFAGGLPFPPGAHFTAPILTAFATPNNATRNKANLPTITGAYQVIASGAAAQWAAPARACGYRLFTSESAAGGVLQLNSQQIQYDGTLVQQDVIQTSPVMLSQPNYFFPLHPDTQAVQIGNTEAVNARHYSVQWVLDLA